MRAPNDKVISLGWQVSSACVRGKRHADAGQPNQDSVHVATSDTGDVVCAVVSDGAGTAERAAEGASHAARRLAEYLRDFGASLAGAVSNVDDVRAAIEAGVECVRAELASRDAGLNRFHSTCVIWLCLPEAGYIGRIGDSVALASRFAAVGEGEDAPVDYFPDGLHALYGPDRGEYANETYFLTQDDWRDHLQVSALEGGTDVVVLMTDGAMDVALLHGRVFRGFMSTLVARLLHCAAAQQRDEVVDGWFSDPATHAITDDDKTMFIAIRRCASADWAARSIHLAPPLQAVADAS